MAREDLPRWGYCAHRLIPTCARQSLRMFGSSTKLRYKCPDFQIAITNAQPRCSAASAASFQFGRASAPIADHAAPGAIGRLRRFATMASSPRRRIIPNGRDWSEARLQDRARNSRVIAHAFLRQANFDSGAFGRQSEVKQTHHWGTQDRNYAACRRVISAKAARPSSVNEYGALNS